MRVGDERASLPSSPDRASTTQALSSSHRCWAARDENNTDPLLIGTYFIENCYTVGSCDVTDLELCARKRTKPILAWRNILVRATFVSVDTGFSVKSHFVRTSRGMMAVAPS